MARWFFTRSLLPLKSRYLVVSPKPQKHGPYPGAGERSATVIFCDVRDYLTFTGLCMKTRLVFPNGLHQKCFINVCHSPWVHDLTIKTQGDGSTVNMPFSLGAPRPDKDKSK